MEGFVVEDLRNHLDDVLGLQEEKDYSIGIDDETGKLSVFCIHCKKQLIKCDHTTLKAHFESKKHKYKSMDKNVRSLQSLGRSEHDIFLSQDKTQWGCRLCPDNEANKSFGGGQLTKHFLSKHVAKLISDDDSITKKRIHDDDPETSPSSYCRKRLCEEAEKRMNDPEYVDHLIEVGYFDDQIDKLVMEKLKFKF